MFKNGVTLNKNGWYVHLMDFMWGASWSNFPNLCPLFWGVIGSIVIFPFWCIWMMFAWIFKAGKPMWASVGKVICALGGISFAMAAVYIIVHFVGGALNSLILAIFVGTSYTWALIGMMVLISTILIILCIGAAFLMTYLSDVWGYHKGKNHELFDTSKGYVRFAGDLIYYPVSSVTGGFSFLWKTIHSIYKKCCPLITWK